MTVEYFEDTVELPFKGHAPNPQIKQECIDEFLRRAREAHPNGTQGEPEVIQTCLVTGQSFAMSLSISVVSDAVKAVNLSERSTESNSQHRSTRLGPVVQTEGSAGDDR